MKTIKLDCKVFPLNHLLSLPAYVIRQYQFLQLHICLQAGSSYHLHNTLCCCWIYLAMIQHFAINMEFLIMASWRLVFGMANQSKLFSLICVDLLAIIQRGSDCQTFEVATSCCKYQGLDKGHKVIGWQRILYMILVRQLGCRPLAGGADCTVSGFNALVNIEPCKQFMIVLTI